jgi:A/G-specific adenine glycosylase
MLNIAKKEIMKFQKTIWDFYNKNKRSFPWRDTQDPYLILVSEIMLQQTQASRVKDKYLLFIKKLPNFRALQRASFQDVLKLWQGLGYNRRAIFLKKIAIIVTENFKGSLPNNPTDLLALPGIGKGTVGSILAFAFNKPEVFIETNIRRVFIHFFFSDVEKVHDKEISPLIAETLDTQNPREWYFALMDYGAMLRGNTDLPRGNPNKKSAHYKVQSKFKGSNREVRGALLKMIAGTARAKGLKQEDILSKLVFKKRKILSNLKALIDEGFVEIKGGYVKIKN